MSDQALPEPDRVPGAPHPREAQRLVGQDAAVADFLRVTHHAMFQGKDTQVDAASTDARFNPV